MKTSTVNLTWKRLCVLFSFVTLSFTQLLVAAPILNCNNINVTISCTTPLDETPKPSVTSNCGSAAEIALTYEDDLSRLDDCGHSGIIIRTYTATDACSETAICVQTITITNEAPVLVCDNLDQTIACTDGRGENDLPRPTVTDDCTAVGNTTLTFVDDFSGLDNCGDAGIFTRTWTATDACGLTSTCVQTITVTNDAPVLNCNNLDVTIACDESTDYNDLPIPTFSDDCTSTNELTLTFSEDLANVVDCNSLGTIIRIWTVTDECGNTASCRQTITVLESQTTNLLCQNIQIEATNNQLSINNITAPNPIVKIFDPNWQLISECSGDCPETVTISNLIAGEIYHTDIQLYDENWRLLCEDKQDIEIMGDGEPCDTSVCQGNIVLGTQEEVDAFCGCIEFEGTIIIGDPMESFETDIRTLENLKGIKKITGQLAIIKTQLANLNGLDSLNFVGSDLIIKGNDYLENLNGLSNLEKIDGFLFLIDNKKLDNIESLNKLKSVGSIELINISVSDISVFSNLENNQLDVLNIFNLSSLKNLYGLENITTINNTLSITQNNLLENIEGLKNIDYIKEGIYITNNALLGNCCSILNLVDNNIQNGFVEGLDVVFNNNLNSCNSAEAISQACQTPAPLCENIQIQTQNNQIIIEGLTAPNEIVKVFDKDFNIVYQCVANCEATQMAGTFPVGNYTVDLQLYDENWVLICAEQRVVTVESGSENPCEMADCETIAPVLTNIPADITVECDAVPSDPTNITATDNCDDNVDIYYEEVRRNGSCVDNYTLTRTWAAFDDCGNSASRRQVITIIDSTAPILANIPADMTVECDAIPTFSENVRATDNCDSDVEITLIEERIDGNCPDNYVLTRTWIATDNCGNLAQGIQTIVVVDITPPVLTNVPANLTFNANDGFDTTFPTSTDNCDADVELTVEDAINSAETEIVRTFTATDNCGNTSTAQQIITIIQDGNNLCEAIEITTTNGAINFKNIDAPNSIVKVFDANYQIIFDCTASCESELVVPVVGEGVYHTDVQFYDENWGFICEDKRDVLIESSIEPCDTSICQGDVVLQTQAEVDAFCGCEVIEGNLVLLGAGVNNGILGQASDIFDIQNFNQLKKIKGDLVIWNTDIISLYGFSKLERIEGSLVFKYNQKINELIGFNSLTNVGSLILEYNPLIKNLRGIQNIAITDNINIIGNENLSSIAELSNLKTLNSGLIITENSKLENLAGLQNLEIINNLTIERNPILSNCCNIVHLLNDNLSTISISDNALFCNSLEEIFQNCQNQSNCIRLKPDATEGKDATVWSNGADKVLLNVESLTPYTWTNGGRLGVKRVFLDFDFSTIPTNAVITEASLSLYHNPTDPYEGFDVHTGANNLGIQRVIADWDANTVTWNNQPITSTTNQVYLPPSTTGTQDYLDIDVTRLVQDMVTEPAAGNGFLIRLRDETNYYKSALFASSDHPNPALHPEINICWEIDDVPTTDFDCNTPIIAINQNNLVIAQLTAPIQIVKVFDTNFATVYECFAECEETINLTDLAAGTYYVNLNFYDENWQPICERIETVEIAANAQDRNTPFLPTDFALFPNPAEATTTIDLSKLKGESVQLVLYNQFGQKVSQQDLAKVGEEKVKIDLSTVSNGLYILQIASKGRRNIAKKLIVKKLY